jgi:hypothetical protein
MARRRSRARPTGTRRGQYYCYELIGLEVVDVSGERIGTVSDVLTGGGNDLLVVSAGERAPGPDVDRMVTAVDLARRLIVVDRFPACSTDRGNAPTCHPVSDRSPLESSLIGKAVKRHRRVRSPTCATTRPGCIGSRTMPRTAAAAAW